MAMEFFVDLSGIIKAENLLEMYDRLAYYFDQLSLGNNVSTSIFEEGGLDVITLPPRIDGSDSNL